MTRMVKILTLSRVERLAILLEELGEAQQVVGKILRHGYHSQHPDGGPDNADLLEIELGDVLSSIDLLCEAGDLDQGAIDHARREKPARRAPYLHHQERSP